MDKNQKNNDIDLEQARLDQEISANKLAQEIMIESQSPLTTLYSWTAPERVFSPKTRKWYVGVATIAMLFIVYSALTSNLVLIFLVVSLVLVVYSMYSIPPQKTSYRITNKGINAFESLYLWRNFLYFWVTKRGNEHVINFEFKEKITDLYYQRMIILVGEGDLRTIVGYLVRHVDYLTTSQRSIMSSMLEGKYIPLLDIVKLEDITEAKEDREQEKTK
jgi:hypothetical protein